MYRHLAELKDWTPGDPLAYRGPFSGPMIKFKDDDDPFAEMPAPMIHEARGQSLDFCWMCGKEHTCPCCPGNCYFDGSRE